MDFDTRYKALEERNLEYEGRFIVAVKTTGIFCRIGCRARTPKQENVEFFGTARQALLAGYRPCKLCHPLEPRAPLPETIVSLLREVEENPGIRIRDDELKRRGIEPETVRRWFKRQHGMTFQGYQRARRLGIAFGLIRQGHGVADAAFQAGYESLSSFNDQFRKAFGGSPMEKKNARIITVTRLESPLGMLFAGAVDEGVCLLEFADRRTVENELDDLKRLLDAAALPGTHPLLDKLAVELEEYFSGARKQFTLPLVMPGRPFQKSVWDQLRSIPYGETRSYKEQAAAIGNPDATRAAASANGQNRIAIVVPCHRVIGSDGSLTGYGGGVWRKRWLLDLESGRKSLF